MATTIIQTTLTTTISENISINGVEYGNIISKTIDGNGKVDQRVMEINSAALTPIFDFTDAAPDSAGSGVKNEFTYFRVTNVDDSIAVTLELYVSSIQSSYIRIPAGCSFVLMNNYADAKCGGEEPFNLRELVKLSVQSDLNDKAATTAYVEYLAVFKGGVPLPDSV